MENLVYGHQFIGFRARWGCLDGPAEIAAASDATPSPSKETPRLELNLNSASLRLHHGWRRFGRAHPRGARFSNFQNDPAEKHQEE
jgi:hypothetical protein